MIWTVVGYGFYHILPQEARIKQEKVHVFYTRGKRWMEEQDFSKAALAFRNAISIHDKDPKLSLAYGQCLIKLGHPAESFREFTKAIRLSPNLWEAHLELARLSLRGRFWKKCTSHAERVCELNPGVFEAYVLGITGLLAKGQKGKAKQVLTRGISECKVENLRTILKVAELSGKVEEFGQAKVYYEKALALAPESIAARIGLAAISTQQSQWELAMKNIKNVLAIDPENRQAILHRAELYIAMKELDKAVEDYENLVQKYLDAPYLKTRLAFLYGAMERKDESLILLDEVLARYPNYPDALLLMAQVNFDQKRYRIAAAKASRISAVNYATMMQAHRILARSYVELEEYDKAIVSCNRVLESDSENLTMKILLAFCHHQIGEFDTATELYKEVARIKPDSHIPALYLGNLYNSKKEWKAAISWYETTLEKQPDNAIAANNLASLLLRTGRDGDIDRACQLMEGFPFDDAQPLAYDTYGWLLFHKGEYEQSKVYLRKATKLYSNHPVLYYHLGNVYFRLNQWEEAKAALERALKINPEFEEAEEAKRLLAMLKDR